VEPLAEVKVEIEYLEQVEAAIAQMDKYQTEDLEALKEIREELIQQRYLEDPGYRSRSSAEASSTNFQRYHSLATLKC